MLIKRQRFVISLSVIIVIPKFSLFYFASILFLKGFFTDLHNLGKLFHCIIDHLLHFDRVLGVILFDNLHRVADRMAQALQILAPTLHINLIFSNAWNLTLPLIASLSRSNRAEMWRSLRPCSNRCAALASVLSPPDVDSLKKTAVFKDKQQTWNG